MSRPPRMRVPRSRLRQSRAEERPSSIEDLRSASPNTARGVVVACLSQQAGRAGCLLRGGRCDRTRRQLAEVAPRQYRRLPSA